jgi:YesN/AraC family two-component response regulator
MRKYKLLIADDERIIREGLASFSWDNLGFEVVHTAADGEEAISFLQQGVVDVILTDIKMPVMDGLDICRYISKNKLDCKVIILTGHKDFDYARTAISTGVFDYLLKPVDLDEIDRVFTLLKIRLDERLNVSESIETGYLPVIRNVISFIEEHYAENISLEEIADSVSLSPGYLSSQFSKETNKTVIEYLTHIRINHAKVLLKDVNYKIYEIAEKVGYPNVKYFYDVFKRNTGMSPNQFRKQR